MGMPTKPITPNQAAQKNKAIDDLTLDTAIKLLNGYLAEHFHEGTATIVPANTIGPTPYIRERVAKLFIAEGWQVNFYGGEQYTFSAAPSVSTETPRGLGPH
jgi:hypothetical protein